MSKTKKVADEAKTRIKHVFTRNAGIHEGVYRDEPGWFNSNYHAYCFGYGYFFTGGEYIGKQLTLEYIRENWNKRVWMSGLQGRCIAYIDRRRKRAVINRNYEYAYEIKYALPYGYIIYELDEVIPALEPTSSKNRTLLIKAVMRTLIKDYLDTYAREYKVAKNVTKSKICKEYTYKNRNRIFASIKELYENYNKLPYYKPLQSKYKIENNFEIDFPSISQILNNKLFTPEETHIINKCKFYTEYCYQKDISWKDVDKHYDDDEWRNNVIDNDKKSIEIFKNKIITLKQQLVQELLDNNKRIDNWRNGNISGFNKCYGIISNETSRVVRRVYYSYKNRLFANTQLRLKHNKPNWVETSKGAIVDLYHAIKLFNYLYINYIVNGITNKMFNGEYSINKFKLFSICYCEKFDEVYNTSLGYYEYKIVIGCHTLWFDDIKNFARYYNLQKYLAFPINKTTDECIKEHLINTNIENYG